MASPRRIVSLNGKWDLAFDPENVGKKRKWFARFPRSVKMQVPGVWEMVRPGYDGVGWYRRTFDAPARCDGRSVRLKIGAAAYYAECWLNGKYLGSHEGGYMPFEFEVSGSLKPAGNQLIVRVINPPINEELEGFRAGAPLNQGFLPIGKGGWYFNFGGIWQEVELIVTDRVYVEDIYVQPLPSEKKAVLNVTVRNGGRAGAYDLTCRVASQGAARPEIARTLSVRLKKGANRIKLAMPFGKVRPWSPDDPHLYVATVGVGGADGPRDELSARFGMREFAISDGVFTLNGKKIKLVGFLQQGMYPRTLCYPETKAFARKELRMIKEGGFNFIRAHLKPTNPWYLDMCDEMGLVVMAEPPIGWIGKSPHTERRCRTEIEEMILRDRNHPCIVMWCLMNEAYHFRGFTMKEIRAMTTRLGSRGRELDGTRLLADVSGGTGSASPSRGTKIWLPNSNRTAAMIDDHGYCPLPLQDASLLSYRTRGARGVAYLNSEYGAPESPPNYPKVLAAYRPRERKLGYEDYQLHKDFWESFQRRFRQAGLSKAFGRPEKMLAATDCVRGDEVRLVTMVQRSNPRIGGLALCQLADASGEIFGALDVWRKPKQVWRGMVAAAQKPLIVPEVYPRLQRAGGDSKAACRATLVNDDLRGRSYTYRLEVATAGGRVVKRLAAGTVRARDEVQTLFDEAVELKLKPGKYHLRATLKAGTRIVSDQPVEFTVLPALRAKTDHLAVFEPTRGVKKPRLAEFFRRLGVRSDVFSHSYRNKNVPVLFDLTGGMPSRGAYREVFGQAGKFARLGGSVVMFGADATMLYEYMLPKLIRIQGVMRTEAYVKPHPIFAGLPTGAVGYEYADLYPDKWDKGDDVIAAGGDVHMGGFWAHMWTRPAAYYWAAGLYTVPVERGHVIICNMNVLENLGANPVADTVLLNLVDYAASMIKRGGEKKLFARCIDRLDGRQDL